MVCACGSGCFASYFPLPSSAGCGYDRSQQGAASPSSPNPNGCVRGRSRGTWGVSCPAPSAQWEPGILLCSRLCLGLPEHRSRAGRADCSMWAFLPPGPSCYLALHCPHCHLTRSTVLSLSPCLSLLPSLGWVLARGPLAMLSRWPSHLSRLLRFPCASQDMITHPSPPPGLNRALSAPQTPDHIRLSDAALPQGKLSWTSPLGTQECYQVRVSQYGELRQSELGLFCHHHP